MATDLHVIVGTGPLGLAVARELAARGRRARLVNRRGQAEAPAGVEVVRGDATDHDQMRAACQGASVVYQCVNAPYTRWPEEFPALQAGVLAGASAAGARLIVGENTYMYGIVDGPQTEDLLSAATTRKGRVRGQMARALLETHARGAARVAIGRASDFYGPGVLDSALGERVLGPAVAGRRVTMLGDLDAPHTYTYIDDFARGLVILGERDEALGRVWHVPSAPTITARQIIEAIFAAAGHPPRLGAVPNVVIQLLGLVDPMMGEVSEILHEFDRPFIVDHGAFERAFGAQTPHAEAIARTVAWYRQHAASSAVAA